MPDKNTNVIFMNHSATRTEPNKIKIGTWTEKQKTDFLNRVMGYTRFSFDDRCSFSVHFDRLIIHSCMFENPKLFTPIWPKNKKDELIIEVIPSIEYSTCWAARSHDCPTCIQNGGCLSWFIREQIGKTLFPDKYAKQR